jgi:hypothetical protein
MGAIMRLSIESAGNVVAGAISDKENGDQGSEEKALAAEKELAGAGLFQGALASTAKNAGASGGMVPDGCESLESEENALDAKASAVTWQKAMTGGNARSTVGSDNAGKSMREVLDTHNDTYCSDIDEARGRCYVPGNGLQNADIMASTVLVPNAGSTLSDEEFEASRRFVTNVTNAVPTQNLPPALESSSAGQSYVLEQRRQAARLSLSQNALNRIIASERVRY